MPKFPVKLITALALAGVSLGELPAPAQEAAGEATITDSQQEPITESEPLPTPGEAAETSDSSIASYPADSSSYGMPGYGYGAMGYPDMPAGGVPVQSGSHWYGYIGAGPDWMRPIRRPIYRVPVQYARYWPTSYYTGVYDPRALYSQPLPMVYMPTDTTQLGFYHQRVPTWLPRPNAIPGPPWPPNWHYTVSTGGGFGDVSGWDTGGYGGYPVGDYGTAGSYGMGTTLDSQSQSTSPPAVIHPEETPSDTGSSTAPVAPAPVDE